MKKIFTIYILSFLLLFLAINGIVGGGLLILKPDGSLLEMRAGFLNKTPFSSFLIPGVLLILFNGLLPLIALLGIFTRKKIELFQRINVFKDKFWGWTWSLYCGIITILWIIVQQLITEYFILQPLICGLGLAIVITSLTPGIQKYYMEDPDK